MANKHFRVKSVTHALPVINGQLAEFVNRYNQKKRLKSLNYVTPAQ